MIQVAPGTKIHLACRPVSMRYGFDGLSAKVASVLALDPYSGRLALREATIAPLVADLETWMRGERAKLAREAEL